MLIKKSKVLNRKNGSEMFIKGDILLPSNRLSKEDWLNGLYHPAILWDDLFEGNRDFLGIMLTHSLPNGRFKNILMATNHIEAGHEIGFSNTCFVNQVFVKFQKWRPFEMVGRLTSEGIHFIENHLDTNSFPMKFTHYRQLVIR